MKTVLVNLVDLDPPTNGGMSRVAFVVSRLLADLSRQNKVRVAYVVDVGFASRFRQWIEREEAFVIPVVKEAWPVPLVARLKPDLLVSPLFGMEPFSSSGMFSQVEHLVSMPDTLALDKPALFPGEVSKKRRQSYLDLQKATRVVTLSQDARKRLLRHLELDPEKVSIIPLAGDLPDPVVSSEPFDVIPGPYVFYPANGWPHKRHDFLFQVMAQIWRVRPDVFLVLAGWQEKGLVEFLAQKHGCPLERIINLGHIADNARMKNLYRHAEAMLFVSQYEGFGMPLVEAMREGCPVITSAVTSIPEVAGDAALYVDPRDPHAWADAFLTGLPPQRHNLIQKGLQQAQVFSWQVTTEMWTNLFAEMGLFDASEDPAADPFEEIKQLLPENETWNEHYSLLLEQNRSILRALAEKEARLESLKFLQPFELPLSQIAFQVQRIQRLLAPRVLSLVHYPPEPLQVPPQYFNPVSSTARPLPGISIVTPSYNQGMFLEKTIASVLDQQYPRLEYGVQDGGSVDETVEVLAAYSPRLSFVDVRRDKGQAHAINMGFAHTGNEIMAYLNSDDTLLPGSLHYVADFFQRHPSIDVIYGHRLIIDKNGDEVGRWILPPHEDSALLWHDYIPQETLFWRRSIWDKAGGYIDENYQFALDWEMLMRFRQAGARFARVPRFLACFRIHDIQKTSSQMFGVGLDEMNRLRQRVHGYVPSNLECDHKSARYRAKSVLFFLLYKLRLLKH